MRLLVVDDHADSADAMRLVLSAWGHEVRVAPDGRTALDSVNEFTPEAVLMDLHVGGESGADIARQLRATHGLGDVAFIAVSGSVDTGELKELSAREGFVEHLVKPVAPDRLREVIASLGAA